MWWRRYIRGICLGEIEYSDDILLFWGGSDIGRIIIGDQCSLVNVIVCFY